MRISDWSSDVCSSDLLDALADARVLQHVDAFELHIEVREDLHHGGREAALREHRRALHEEHHLVVVDLLLDPRGYGFIHQPKLLSAIVARAPPRGGPPFESDLCLRPHASGGTEVCSARAFSPPPMRPRRAT